MSSNPGADTKKSEEFREIHANYMITSPQPTAPNARASIWLAVGEIVLTVAIFYLSTPEPPPGVNEPHYLCRLRHAVDPSFCAGDFFLETPDAHAIFVFAFAWTTRIWTLPVVAWLGRLVCWVLLAWAWRRLCWLVVPQPLFSSLAASLWVVGIAECNFAGEWVVGGFEAKCLAYVFVLLGLRAWLLNKWNWTWIHLGLASAWHALVGGWSVLILLGIWAAVGRRDQSLRGMLPGLLTGGLISLAGLAPALALNHGAADDAQRQAAEIYVFERLPHHLAPLHKPSAWIAERAGRHSLAVVLLAALLWVRRQSLGGWSKLASDPAARLAQYAAGAMVLAMIGLVIEFALFDNAGRAAPLLRYYWFRLTDVAVPLAASALWIRLLADLLAERNRMASAMLGVMLLTAGVPLGLGLVDFVQHPTSAADARLADADDWIAVCHWVRENTPEDALCLTPRGQSSFKWHAHRGEVVTYKDVPQNATSLVEWKRRLYDVFKIDGEANGRWAGNLGELGTPRIMQLAREYEFRYVVTTRGEPLALPIAAMNDTYVVYEVPPRDSPNP